MNSGQRTGPSAINVWASYPFNSVRWLVHASNGDVVALAVCADLQ